MQIPYGRQDITQADIKAVIDVLKSDFLTQGPCVPRFERRVSEYCGIKHAVAVNSATSALHLACLSLGLKTGDWLWTTPITFVASANCGLYCGAKVDFVDIDSATYNLCPKALEGKLIKAKELGKLPKVVVPVHLCGQSCDMKAIHELSKEYGFRIIEDASHAIGGRYLNESIGNCKYSDITILSFHPVKIITTGEGGMALTNNPDLARSMSLLRSHGITREHTEMVGENEGPWFYQQKELGFNYRMTDLQAALGTSQHKRLDEFVQVRNDLASRYIDKLADLPISVQTLSDDIYSAYHLFVINLQDHDHIKSRQRIFVDLREAGIGVNVHYIPVHLHPFYKEMGFTSGDFPFAEKYYQSAITLPLFPTLTINNQDYVVKRLKESLGT
jgi:UDP-4-amino-4,6-dideoxy-N-acetyl-beta-L-altrosamine transaminase